MPNVSEMRFFMIAPAEVPVVICEKKYVLREATGEVACRYRNAIFACTRLASDGNPARVTDMADVEPFLVSMCLFEVSEDNSLKPVTEKTVRAWPARIQTALYERAREISGLGEGAAMSAQDRVERLRQQLAEAEAEAEQAKNSP